MRELRVANSDLKIDNENLIGALKMTQDNFRKEIMNAKDHDRQMRDQMDQINRMQVGDRLPGTLCGMAGLSE